MVMINPTGSSSASSYFYTAPVSGMRRAEQQANTAAESIASGDLSAENMVSLNESKIMMKANAATLKAADSMMGTLLDEKA